MTEDTGVEENTAEENTVLPRHIAIIMDGNGRWAQQRSLPRTAGHQAGVKSIRAAVEQCAIKKIDSLTLFAFSSENWRRPRQEIDVLMGLFVSTLEHETESLNENGIRLRFIGDKSAFSAKLQKKIVEAEKLTRNNTVLNLSIAANYGGRWDIMQAVRKLAINVERGVVSSSELTHEALESHLSFSDLPEPDLFIRTGGECRISNFLLWQLAYTELYFTPTLWPDFDKNEFELALEDYVGRQRRFGFTGEQIESNLPKNKVAR